MIRHILSRDNHFVKLATSLQQRKYRESTGLFVVEGARLVQEALASAWAMEYAMISDEQAGNERIKDLLIRLEERSCPVLSLPTTLYRKVSDTENPQGILAVIRQKVETLEDIPVSGPAPLWVILDSVQDPGNVGTIVRTADAAGAAGVLLANDCADLFAGKTTRASMGSLFHIPVVITSVRQCLSFCSQQDLALYVAGAEAAVSYSDTNLSVPCAIVFGNEGAGVGEEFRRAARKILKIPIVGQAESLNVASAAAVILFEAARQRGMAL